MTYLIDTNVLLRSVQPTHPQFQLASEAIYHLRSNGHDLPVVPQIIYEFWVVATRPIIDNGLGMSIDEAATKLRELRNYFLFCNEAESIFSEWEALVTSSRVAGKPAHDARLVAAMKIHAIDHVLTFNVQDFKRFTAITVHSPSSILQHGKSV